MQSSHIPTLIAAAAAAAAAVVSARVHPACRCVRLDGTAHQNTTALACAHYPRNEFFARRGGAAGAEGDADADGVRVADAAAAAAVWIGIDAASGACQTRDAATRAVRAFLGGKQFQAACRAHAPDYVELNSQCFD